MRKAKLKRIHNIIKQEMKQIDKHIEATYDYKHLVALTNRYNLLKKRKENLK